LFQPHARDDKHPTKLRCDNPSQTRPQEPLTVSTTPVEPVDPPINGTTQVSLADMGD
jgi:hypothetical protein